MTKMRNVDQRQLTFVFVDNPRPGSRDAIASGVLEAKAWLRQIAKAKGTYRSTAKVVPDSKGLLEQVAARPNLAESLLNVARNKGAAGVDRISIQDVLLNVRALLDTLHHALLTEHYRPGDIRRVWIPKPNGGQRGLGIPNVIDRWVQEATRLILEPLFEPHFHVSSHGFRPKRGAQTAVAQAKGFIEAGFTTVVDLDISKFFDRVHHQRLLNRMAQRVCDGRVLQLIHRLLKARVVLEDGVIIKVDKGTPQGGPLSPLLSNIVLDELDWQLDRRGLHFVRYADDVSIFVQSQRAGERVMSSTCRFIEKRLRLEINEAKSSVTTPDKIHFLGFCFRKNRTGGYEVHLSSLSDQRIRLRIRELTPRKWGQSLSRCIAELNQYLRGWYGYFGRICTKMGVSRFKTYDSHIRRRLRMIIIRQKGRPRYLYRHLKQCGVPGGSAYRAAYCQRGLWFKSSRRGINMAYGISWFESRVYTLWLEWQRKHPGPFMAPGGQFLLFAL
jgi:RNA-directed DNA polymerase